MAAYTTEVKSIIEYYSTEGKSWNERIDEAALVIFDFPYPIWEESYRPVLNRKILRHYFRREIGEETVGAWRFSLETRMEEIMPHYVELYKTTLEEFDGSNDIDITTILKRDVKSEQNEKTTGTNVSSGNNVGLDYPQAGQTATDKEYYASQEQTAENKSDGTSERKADSAGDENSTQTRKGRLGARTQGDIINSFRESLIEIDLMIIRDLKGLFFPLWPNYASFYDL